MSGAAYPCQYRPSKDKVCGLSRDNSIHQKGRQQFGHHDYISPKEKDTEPSVYSRRLQFLRNVAEKIEDIGSAKDMLVELIEVLIEEAG